ncbi:MAG: M23 family metallopeptidase [bacterium]
MFRIFANIQEIDEDTWDIGTGGSEQIANWNGNLKYSASQDSAMDILVLLERLEQQANLLLESQTHIEKKFVDDQNLRLHTPTIFPVQKGAVTSKFGYRADPFIQKMKHHNGLDIVAEKGSPVIAPSNGTVVFARSTYRRDESLGKVIVIDHGFGIRTRYGHLSKIYVRAGDKVKRYDMIGEVGSTGRSTGTHLHYEVITDGKFQNPEEFILN